MVINANIYYYGIDDNGSYLIFDMYVFLSPKTIRLLLFRRPVCEMLIAFFSGYLPRDGMAFHLDFSYRLLALPCYAFDVSAVRMRTYRIFSIGDIAAIAQMDSQRGRKWGGWLILDSFGGRRCTQKTISGNDGRGRNVSNQLQFPKLHGRLIPRFENSSIF